MYSRNNSKLRGGGTVRTMLRLEDGALTSFTKVKSIKNKSDLSHELDNTDTFLQLAQFKTDAKGDNFLDATKGFCIYNTGAVPIEVQFTLRSWAHGAPDTDGSATFVTMMINPGDFYYSPTGRMIHFDTENSSANSASLDNVLPSDTATDTFDGGGATYDGPFYMDSGVNVNASEGSGDTSLVFQSTGKFRVGDILALDSGGGTTIDEFIRVESIVNGTTMICERGFFGSTAQSLSSSTDVHFYFHNHLYDIGSEDDSKTHIRTDASGQYQSNNFFGYGRSADTTPGGIVPGSVAIKFFPAVSRRFGLSITSSSDTGLTAGTTYEFRVTTITGTTADIAVTIDSSNTKFGGTNGLLQKMNSAFRSSTATDFLTASLNAGDVEITDRRGLKGNSVTMVAPSDGTSIWGVGNIPAIADHEAIQVASLGPDTTIDVETGATTSNTSLFMYDDGQGVLKGAGQGTISYDTGAISFGGPYRAEFVVSAQYQSAHSGKMNTATNYINIIEAISARSVNSKVNARARIIIYT